MRFGKFNKLVTFRKESENSNDDSLGAKVKDWTNVRKAWAEIIPLKGDEYFSANQHKAKVTHKIRTRFIRGITTDTEIIYNNRTFEIVSPPINVREENRELHIMALERG